MVEAQVGCRCTSSAYATTRMSGIVCCTRSNALRRFRAKKGAAGITPADPWLEGEKSGMSWQSVATRIPWAQHSQATKGRSQGVPVATACRRACRETLLKSCWKSSSRITSSGQQGRSGVVSTLHTLQRSALVTPTESATSASSLEQLYSRGVRSSLG
jgi:hypothetical protein